MAELTIDPASIRKALDDFVSSYKPSDTPTQEVGYVATAGDGIAHVTGLPGCMANELLTFEDGTLGPVSYTHLYVYKRQIWGRGSHGRRQPPVAGHLGDSRDERHVQNRRRGVGRAWRSYVSDRRTAWVVRVRLAVRGG